MEILFTYFDRYANMKLIERLKGRVEFIMKLKRLICAAASGIINGTGNGTFSTYEVITREQIAAIFYRYAESKGLDVSLGDSDISSALEGY